MISAEAPAMKHRVPPDGFGKVAAFFMRDWRMAVSYSANFWLGWVSVFVDVAIAFYIAKLVHPSANFGYDNKPHSYFDYLVVNTAFLSFQRVAVLAFAQAIRDGQTLGTLEVVLATPTSLPFMVLSSGLYSFAFQLVQSLFYIAVALLFGLDIHSVNVATLLVFIALAIAAISPIGVIAAAATMAFKKTGPVEYFLTSATQLFGGIYLPVKLLPVPFQIIGTILPITHALNGIRAALQGATLAQLSGDLMWLCGLTAVFLPLSLWIFAYAVHRAKIDGTLGQY